MKKVTLATLALAMSTALIAAPQGQTGKSKAPTKTTDTKGGEKGKDSKKGKTKGEKEKGKDKGTKLHEHTN
jgi:hypothetical protein